MPHIILYSTSACHLCEQAKALLWPLKNDYPFSLEEIDIADSDELIARYGIRIPVLVFSVAKGEGEIYELGWPFDEDAIRRFLDSQIN